MKPTNKLPAHPHANSGDEILTEIASSRHGLTPDEASARLAHYGPNSLPHAKEPGIIKVFFLQFASPLIYILVAAALLSLIIQEWSDAIFITGVLFINAIIGTIQEYSAQRAATALQKLVKTSCRVLRGENTYKIDSEELVPGDIILLESGDRIPADVRLLSSNDLEADESLLTGESKSVFKDANQVHAEDTFIGDRRNMVFAGTLISRGKGLGVVVGTSLATELGNIAASVLGKRPAKAPLLIRMEKFTNRVAIFVSFSALILASVAITQGIPIAEIFLLAVALAVSAMPEGLPVAITVALAVGMRRMAKRNVIIRRLPTVEALGSCTYIATDKTGTLTMNQLTGRRIVWPDGNTLMVKGYGMEPDGSVRTIENSLPPDEASLLQRLCRASVLPNNAFLEHTEDGWTFQGDADDVALLVLARKAGVDRPEMVKNFPELATIPFESERLFSASLNRVDNAEYGFVKGAMERILSMCATMAVPGGDIAIDKQILLRLSRESAKQGYRVIALAEGKIEVEAGADFAEEALQNLTFLGMIGMIDPLRPEAKETIALCHRAGIEIAMITGDHPATALAIARELELADEEKQIVTGSQLRAASDTKELDELTLRARVFARVTPQQKLDIVQSLQRGGHFVAVSGDGANDAPAQRAAHVGVAMGKTGTDVARETADLILTDDNFASMVAGIEEGRVSYANVRKVIFLLISTGAAELVLFALALLFGHPYPLIAVQLLWLNLVTNGIQDVALALEPGEGNELNQPPRSPKEPIFNRLMIERVVISAAYMGGVAFLLYHWLLTRGFTLDEARNSAVLLMVLFENVHVFNSRSETLSAFKHNPMRNPVLLFGTVISQLIHIGAMYTPWISDVLHIQPVSSEHWLVLLGLALTILVLMELLKAGRTKFFDK